METEYQGLKWVMLHSRNCVERMQGTDTLTGRFCVCNFGLNPSQHRQSHACPIPFEKSNLEVEFITADRG